MRTVSDHPHQTESLSPILVVLFVTAVLFVSFSVFTMLRGITWPDEVTYLVKSYWYINGIVEPYSDTDATWYMPLFLYQLGLVQDLFGQGHLVGRTMSWVFGMASAVVLFFCVTRLTQRSSVQSALPAALAVMVYLCTPTTAYFFSTATPYATVAFLHALTILFVIASSNEDSLWRSIALGVMFAILYFYRQNMILCAGFLFSFYLLEQPRRRLAHGLCMCAGAAVLAAPLLLAFPDKLFFYALRLPVLTPFLVDLGWLSEELRLIQTSTLSEFSLALSLEKVTLFNIWNSFLMPFAGTVCGSVLAIILIPRHHRRLSVWPAYFFSLAALHYLGSVGYLSGAILAYTNYFVVAGALSCGLAIAFFQNVLPVRWRKVGAVAVAVSLVIVTVAAGPGYNKYSGQPVAYPWSSLRFAGDASDLEKVAQYRTFLEGVLPQPARVLLIHDNDALAYAVARAGHAVPPQVLNPLTHYRQPVPGLTHAEREKLMVALEAESLWSDEIMHRWIERDYGVVIKEEGGTYVQNDTMRRLDQMFEVLAQTDLFDTRVIVHRRRKSEK